MNIISAAIFHFQLGVVFGGQANCTSYAPDAWDTQLTLMLSSDELPDFLVRTGLSSVAVADYGSQGYFLPINNYIEYAPAIQGYIEKYPILGAYMSSPDGNMYMTAKVNDNLAGLAPRTWINKNWLNAVGMSAPTTLDELYDVLVAFKAEDANGNGDATDEVPMGDIDGYISRNLMAAFGIYTTESFYILQADESGTVYAAETTDEYKAYLSFLNKLYSEEILDQEVFIETEEEYKAKIAEDRVGYFSAPAPYVWASKDITYDTNFFWTGAYTSDYNSVPALAYAGKISSDPVMIVSSKTEYPEAAVRLLDYFYTDEGANASALGYEGLSFDYEDVIIDGQTFHTFTYADYAQGYESGEKFRISKSTVNNAFYHVAFTLSYDPLYEMKYESLQSEDALNKWGWAALLTYQGIRNPEVVAVDAFPALVYNEKEADTRLGLKTDITTYLETAQAQFITGEVSIEEGWDNYLNTLNQMGLEDIIAVEQAAYDRLMVNMN